jgi:hypothetical protein
MIDHACEDCGAIRKVSPDKIKKGKQKLCRKCQGPAAAEKRKLAMIARGGKKTVHYAICHECRNDYQVATFDDDGFCGDACREKAKSHHISRYDLMRRFLMPKEYVNWEWKQINLID